MSDDELREQLKALAVQYPKHASKNEVGTNRNKQRGKIDTLKKKLRGSQAEQLYERRQVN